MKEIEVGEYVRTFKGRLIKVREECYYDEAFGEYIIDGEEYHKINIKKHSFNIIDLIEEGDYVNGQRVSSKTKKYIVIEDSDYSSFEVKDIKSIVTKEQMKSVEYEVK